MAMSWRRRSRCKNNRNGNHNTSSNQYKHYNHRRASNDSLSTTLILTRNVVVEPGSQHPRPTSPAQLRHANPSAGGYANSQSPYAPQHPLTQHRRRPAQSRPFERFRTHQSYRCPGRATHQKNARQHAHSSTCNSRLQ